jgi:hypothetical protein
MILTQHRRANLEGGWYHIEDGLSITMDKGIEIKVPKDPLILTHETASHRIITQRLWEGNDGNDGQKRCASIGIVGTVAASLRTFH